MCPRGEFVDNREPKTPLAGVIPVSVASTELGGVQALYRASYTRLVQTVTLTCGNRADAEEAVQEAFIRLISRWRTVSRYDNPEAWVRLVAMRISANRHRRDRNWRSVLRRAAPIEQAPEPCGDAVDVIRALAALPIAQRQVVVLHYLLDIPVETIALELGLPLGTVKSRLKRARSKLAPHLEVEVPDHV
jgi:RNA polymerase sigma-70 factor, ECF subfamily